MAKRLVHRRTPSRLYDAYIFDLDGTVYLGDALLPTVQETITALRASGRRSVFLSNNPTHTRHEYAAKLTRLGLPTPAEDIINSSVVMVDFLRRHLPGGRLFVVGEEPLGQELRAAGFELTDDAQQVDAVIASFDRTFTYRKLQVAFDAIRAGARFFATNADRYCPVPGGGEPDAAAIIAAIEACTNTRVEAVVGKPSRYMIEAVLGLLKVPADRCIMVGDRLETDVHMGLEAGMAAALTLTGATDEVALAASPIQPTYVLHQLGDLLPSSRASPPNSARRTMPAGNMPSNAFEIGDKVRLPGVEGGDSWLDDYSEHWSEARKPLDKFSFLWYSISGCWD